MSNDRLTRYVRHFHENGVKKLLEDGHNLREMLLLAGVDLAERIDPDRIENRSETFIKHDFRHLAADFVVRAPLLHDDGATTWCWVYATSGELLARSGWLGPVLRLFDARRAPPAAFRDILADTIRRLEAMPDALRARWLDFLSFTLALVYHDRDPDEHATLEHTIIESVATDVRRKELRTMRRTIADKFRDEGRAEGQAEGQSIATLETSRAMLLRLLERRFGALPEAIRTTIERTDDVDRLTHWLDQVVTVDTLDEVGIE